MYRTRFGNKYGAIRTEFNGYKYDSKFEASVAQQIQERLDNKEILGFDNQYKVEIELYDVNGKHRHTLKHKVDFRVHNLDGSFTLLEAKGLETADYRMRRLFLEKFFLPNNLDYEYEVVYAKNNYRRKS